MTTCRVLTRRLRCLQDGVRGGTVLLIVLLGPQFRADAFEMQADLEASVEIASIFEVSLSNPHLDFHRVEPGQTRLLGEGNFFNEVRCHSNAGQPWTLSLRFIPQPSAASARSVPQVQFKVVEVLGGSAQPQRGWPEFENLPVEPTTIYTATYEPDVQSREVVMRFQYRIVCPLDAQANNYQGQLIFTMSDAQ